MQFKNRCQLGARMKQQVRENYKGHSENYP